MFSLCFLFLAMKLNIRFLYCIIRNSRLSSKCYLTTLMPYMQNFFTPKKNAFETGIIPILQKNKVDFGRIFSSWTLAWKIWCALWVSENWQHFVIYLWRKVRSRKYKDERREGKYESIFFPGEFQKGGDK